MIQGRQRSRDSEYSVYMRGSRICLEPSRQEPWQIHFTCLHDQCQLKPVRQTLPGAIFSRNQQAATPRSSDPGVRNVVAYAANLVTAVFLTKWRGCVKSDNWIINDCWCPEEVGLLEQSSVDRRWTLHMPGSLLESRSLGIYNLKSATVRFPYHQHGGKVTTRLFINYSGGQTWRSRSWFCQATIHVKIDMDNWSSLTGVDSH